METDNLSIYKIWAPDDAAWTLWAKPVLFANEFYPKRIELSIPEVPFDPEPGAMIIIDLPGRRGVEEALAFAAKGYRPVPLYNGTMGSGTMLVEVSGIKGHIYIIIELDCRYMLKVVLISVIVGDSDVIVAIIFSHDGPPKLSKTILHESAD